jgi:hypothetical protein
VESLSNRIAAQKKAGRLPPGLLEQFELQINALKDDTIPDLEVAMMPMLLANDGMY